MFIPTKLHENTIDKDKRKFTIRIGETVPKEAVNLAYYFSKKIPIEDSILISDAPKTIIDHISVEHRETKLKILSDDPNNFTSSWNYNDVDGYSAILKRRSVDWESYLHTEEKDKIFSPEPYLVTVTNDAPLLMLNFIDEKYRGNLTLYSQIYEPTKFIQEETTESVSMYFTKLWEEFGLATSYYDFPNEYTETIDQQGYTGSLYRIDNSIEYTPSGEGQDEIVQTKEYIPVVKGQFPDTIPITIGSTVVTGKFQYKFNVPTSDANTVYGKITSDLKTTLPATMQIKVGTKYVTGRLVANKTIEGTRADKYRGVSRWFGPTIGGACGTGGAGGKFTNSYPNATKERYGPWMQSYGTTFTVKNSAGKVLETWSYDTTESNKYGSPNGCTWMSQYLAKGGKYKFEKDYINPGNNGPNLSSLTAIVSGVSGYIFSANKAVSASAKVISECGQQSSNHFFRDTVQFYKGVIKTHTGTYMATSTVSSQIEHGMYEGRLLTGEVATYSAVCTYANTLYKTVPGNPIDVPIEWSAILTYKGKLTYDWRDYDGEAYYSGIATKRNAIGNINREGTDELLMYSDDNGVLYDELSVKTIENELFYVTDVFKDNVPCFYKYKLKYKLYDRVGPDNLGFYKGNALKVLTPSMKNVDTKKYKYLIKLIKTIGTNNLYDAYIYTSFLTTSTNMFYCSYNAYDNSIGVADEDKIKPGHIENIFVKPSSTVGVDYNVNVENALLKQNSIQIINSTNTIDEREKVLFSYIVKTTDNAFKSSPIEGSAMNIKYAFESELSQFEGRKYILKDPTENRNMTAFEIIKRDNPLALNETLIKKIFTVELFNDLDGESNSAKHFVNLFTLQNGTGVITVETTVDTGFETENGSGIYTRMLSVPGKYKVENGIIYPAYKVKCREVRDIKVLVPRESEALENWYPRIQFSHFTKNIEQDELKINATYTIPEYNNQNYSITHGKPYIDVKKEKAVILNEKTIKVKLLPLYIKLGLDDNPSNLFVRRVNSNGDETNIDVFDYSYTEGIIYLNDIISENDSVLVDYTYEEQGYSYRGFYTNNNEYIDIDVNPNKYHTYLDYSTIPYMRRKTFELLNSTIYFYIKPTRLLIQENGIISDITNSTSSVYHKINDDIPNDKNDLFIGKMNIKNNSSSKSISIIDSRTRGGGILKEISDNLRYELEPESDFYWDIGYWDGEPYTENAIVIIRLDKKILKENGGRFTPQEIEGIVSKWITSGVMPIIEYVTTLAKEELPQSSLKVNDVYENTTVTTDSKTIDEFFCE